MKKIQQTGEILLVNDLLQHEQHEASEAADENGQENYYVMERDGPESE